MLETSTKVRRVLGGALAGLLLAASTVDATAEESGSDGWQFGGEVYLWGATLGATTTAGDDIDISFSDIFEHLNFGFMGAVEARKGKWELFADAIYLDLETEDNSTANIVGRSIQTSVDVEVKGFISTTAASYAVFENDSTRFTLLAGGRYLWLEADLEFDIGALKETASDSNSVVDAIVGFRGRTKIADGWHVVYHLDVGTGQSEFTWQALGSLNYRFKNVDLVLGYRYLDWNFDADEGDVLDDLNIHGPIAGVKFTF